MEVFWQGDVRFSEKLSLEEVGTLTRSLINDKFAEEAVRPQVDSPDQREGEVAAIPIFPNNASFSLTKISSLPKPKDWYEFEDMVWDICIRKWNDPKAKRYGRSGQRKHGIDIYGQPEYLGRVYAGVKCKWFATGKLNKKIIRTTYSFYLMEYEEVVGFL